MGLGKELGRSCRESEQELVREHRDTGLGGLQARPAGWAQMLCRHARGHRNGSGKERDNLHAVLS